ncbi:hypothetical protein B0H15DRAFT_1017884 [Mycena belliarum]|uniref:Uncharacterized protein n=1 Tax=Mycena belliarum TaxID=1033014 RepID=A0AAD6UFM4_9AGAR|nr:hypothetical protein B0H15DRAFT_1017884 [Mycena belliae]
MTDVSPLVVIYDSRTLSSTVIRGPRSPYMTTSGLTSVMAASRRDKSYSVAFSGSPAHIDFWGVRNVRPSFGTRMLALFRR